MDDTITKPYQFSTILTKLDALAATFEKGSHH